ncbi:MAG: MGMT family protein [Acidobacteria bacterium]|nr:MGMT family protein [Acidobacteriota bacterium]MCB9396421.1 MGMT family protein [Acidobacteriota bacterium]
MSQLPLDWAERVWALVALIPEGRVSSYGKLAQLLGFPRHARHVGRALSETPPHIDIPWHRVLNGRGECSLAFQSEGWYVQMALLRAEGILPDDQGRVNLTKYGWQP